VQNGVLHLEYSWFLNFQSLLQSSIKFLLCNNRLCAIKIFVHLLQKDLCRPAQLQMLVRHLRLAASLPLEPQKNERKHLFLCLLVQ